MTAYTKTKINRTFEVEVEEGFKVVRKEKPDPAEPRYKKACLGCQLPMNVSKGQNANYHRDCRKRARHNGTLK